MINKIKSISLVFVAVLALVACSGGGSRNNLSVNTDDNSDDLGACRNIYYPIVEGPIYNYSITTGGETVVQTISFADVSPDGFVSVMDVDEVHSEIHWDCSTAGMVSAEYAQFNVFPGTDVTVETVDISGVVIPAEEDMVVGYEWDSVFTMRVTMNMEGTPFVSDVVINQHLEVVGKEAVSVPAGDYPEALLVRTTATMNMVMGIEGAGDVSIENTFTGTAYYVAGVGLVKQVGTFEGFNSLMELISID